MKQNIDPYEQLFDEECQACVYETEDDVEVIKQNIDIIMDDILKRVINMVYSKITSVHSIYIKTTEYGFKLFIIHTLSDIADVFDQIYPKITKVEEKFNNTYFNGSYSHLDDLNKTMKSKHLTQSNLIFTNACYLSIAL